MFVVARIALAFSLLATTFAQDEPTVEVEQGRLVGVTETFQEFEFIGVNKTVDVYRGIPYAEPPVGPLRFEPPRPKQPWDENDTYNATYFRDACSQGAGGIGMSEDCLHLNIFAPNPPIPGGAAVMVWIHGGGFAIGSTVVPDREGHPLVAVGDVIIVTIHYRLNVFGFLTTDDEVAPGNVGLKDQLLALQWIKQNIAVFGGDSERITIFGESAGAMSVSWHILSRMTSGLFNNAIMQSGTAFSSLWFSNDREKAGRQAFQFGQTLGCSASGSAALLDCLRTKNTTDLLTTTAQMPITWYPVVDGTFVENMPANLYATGRYNHVKILLGSNADEGTGFLLVNLVPSQEAPFINRELFEQYLSAQLLVSYGDSIEQMASAVRMRYIDWSQADYNDTDYFRPYVDFFTDSQFACTTDRVARSHAQGGDDVYLYQMTLAPTRSYWNSNATGPSWTGASHAEELQFVFGVPFMKHAALRPSLRDEEKELSVKFMEYWTNFAKTGNPNSQSETEPEFWPRFTIPELEYKVLDVNLTTSRALKSDKCYFWNSYVPQLNTMLDNLEAVERDWKQDFSTWKYVDTADWRDQFNRYKAANIN